MLNIQQYLLFFVFYCRKLLFFFINCKLSRKISLVIFGIIIYYISNVLFGWLLSYRNIPDIYADSIENIPVVLAVMYQILCPEKFVKILKQIEFVSENIVLMCLFWIGLIKLTINLEYVQNYFRWLKKWLWQNESI